MMIPRDKEGYDYSYLQDIKLLVASNDGSLTINPSPATIFLT